MGDAGLTGRKIIVDTYGGMARHGGGAFSGKDPTKVDRSACYAARWVAKHVVAAGAAERCEVQVAYAIGMAQPISILVETFGTEKVAVERIEQGVRDVFDLRPAAIVRDLNLKSPMYRKTAAYGHFGRHGDSGAFPWEQVDLAADQQQQELNSEIATHKREDLVSRLQADLEYLNNWSIWRDILIMLSTVRVIVHRNAY